MTDKTIEYLPTELSYLWLSDETGERMTCTGEETGVYGQLQIYFCIRFRQLQIYWYSLCSYTSNMYVWNIFFLN